MSSTHAWTDIRTSKTIVGVEYEDACHERISVDRCCVTDEG